MAGTVTRSQLSAGTRASFVPDWATQRDNMSLLKLLRESPMPGNIRISLEREPDFFRAAKLESELHHVAVARDIVTGEPFAMCSRSVRQRFVNGSPRKVGYLSQLRIAGQSRVSRRSLLRTGFEWLRRTRQSDEADFDITTIIEDNVTARRLLTAQLPGLPVYRELESISTMLVPIQRARVSRVVRIIQGEPALLPSIVETLRRFNSRHQFAPCWESSDLLSEHGPGLEKFLVALSGDRVLGCVAFWDQRGFKQAVVRGYAMGLRYSRWILNALGARLPPRGGVLAMAFSSHLAVEEDDPEVFTALMGAALNFARGHSSCRWLVLALASRHPLISALRRFRPREYKSLLYLVHSSGQAAQLDARIPHVEVALL